MDINPALGTDPYTILKLLALVFDISINDIESVQEEATFKLISFLHKSCEHFQIILSEFLRVCVVGILCGNYINECIDSNKK